MKMAVVTEFLAKEQEPLFGGVDSRVINLCQELAKRNEVHVFASLQSGEEGIEHYGDIIVHRIGRSRPFVQRGSFLSRLDFNRKCAKEVAKLDPDIVEASGFVSYSAGLSCRKMTCKPTMVTVHEVWQGEWARNMGPINGAVGNLLERRNLKRPFDKYIAVSDFTKNKLVEDLGIDHEKVCVIYNGVNRSLYDSVDIDSKFDSPTILTICRLVSYKRVDVLIQAVDKLRAKFPDIRLLIVGKGPEEENLRELVSKMGLTKHVEFLGKIPELKDLVRTLKRSHVFALPSTVEGFGMVVIESMAAGIPYVASDIPPIREATKGGVGGILFRPLDVDDLVERLAETLDGQRSNDPRTSAVLKEYDWKNLAREYENEARVLVESDGPRSSYPPPDVRPSNRRDVIIQEMKR